MKRKNENAEAKAANNKFFAVFDKMLEDHEELCPEALEEFEDDPEDEVACFHYCSSADNMIRGMAAFVIENELFALLDNDEVIKTIRDTILEEVSSRFIAQLNPASGKDGDKDDPGN